MVQTEFEKQQYTIGQAVFEQIDKNNHGNLHASNNDFICCSRTESAWTGKLSLEEVKAWAEDKDNTKEAHKFFHKLVTKDGEQVHQTDGEHFFGEKTHEMTKTEFATKYASVIKARTGSSQDQFQSAMDQL